MNQLTFHYSLKKSKRAKYVRITVKPDGAVIVTKPWFMPMMFVTKFLKAKQVWVLNTLKKLSLDTSAVNKSEIWYLGKKYRFQFKIGKLKVVIGNKYFTVHAYSLSAAKRQLNDFFISKARHVITKTVAIQAKKMNLNYRGLRFKNQKTRWGSCSSQGNLNFNWKLIMAPLEVLEYVVIHELAHRKHMNHSKSFWTFVEDFSPDYRQHLRWLKRHQKNLQQL